MVGGETPGGLTGWILQNGQIVAFFAQLIYWLVIAAVSVYAVMLFKRLVDFRTGHGAGSTTEAEKAVSVEEFTD